MKKILVAILLACASPQARAVLPAAPSRTVVTAAGGTIVYFSFKTTSASHIEVFVSPPPAPTYSVTLNANQDSSPGGYITFTSPPAAGAVVTVQRTVPLSQPSVWTFNKPLENALDYVTMIAQQIARDGGGGGSGGGTWPGYVDWTQVTNKPWVPTLPNTSSGSCLKDNGTWGACGTSGGGAPTTSQYVLMMADPALPNAKVLSAGNGTTWGSPGPAQVSLNIPFGLFVAPGTTGYQGGITVPSNCQGAGQAITFNGTTASCITPTPPLPTTSTPGGVKAVTCPAGYLPDGIRADGTLDCVAIGALLASIVTCDGNPPADGNQTFWIDGIGTSLCPGGGATAGPVTFSPAQGTYTSAQTVTLQTSTAGATVCYTTNGSTPAATTAGSCSTGTSILSGATISVSATTTVKALATKAGYSNSAVTSATYTIMPQVPAPAFSPPAGPYAGTQIVSLTPAGPPPWYCYTTDGTDPVAGDPSVPNCGHGSLYSGALTVGSTQTVKAIGMRTGYTSSAIAAGTFTIGAADTTAPLAGTLTVPDTTGMSITGITASATDAVGVVKWKIVEQASDSGWSIPVIDGTWTTITSTTSFSSSSLVFTSGATSTSTRYFRIYFADASGNVGGSATATATITKAVAATPVWNRSSGSYATTAPFSLTCASPSPTIRYTTGGQTPDGSSSILASGGSFTMPVGTYTLKAICQSAGMTDSAVAAINVTITNDTLAPIVSAFTMPATATSLNVNRTTFTCTDDTAVTGYMITTSATPPTAGDANWSGLAPAQGIASGQGTVTWYAWCKDAAGNISASATATTVITIYAATPTITPNGGSISGATSVTLACASPSPTIRYTTDGSTPTGSSTAYSGAFSVASTTTVKAICQSSGMTDSAVASATFTLAVSMVDGFNRADGALGSGWATSFGKTAPLIVSNAVPFPAASGNIGARRTEAFPANQYAAFKVTNAGAGSNVHSQAGVNLRQSASADTSYALLHDRFYFPGDELNDPYLETRVRIGKMVAGTWTDFPDAPYNAGPYYRLDVTDNGTTVTLTVKAKATAGAAWTTIRTYTEPLSGGIAGPGYPAFGGNNDAALDDFEAGGL